MATKEQYLNALLNAKNNAIQNNSVLVNPSNTTTQLSSTSEQEILPQTANQNSEAKWYEKVFGFDSCCSYGGFAFCKRCI